jgi:GH25 family lysozyme M1 (1,4-beta-N-acetylmuramidase)
MAAPVWHGNETGSLVCLPGLSNRTEDGWSKTPAKAAPVSPGGNGNRSGRSFPGPVLSRPIWHHTHMAPPRKAAAQAVRPGEFLDISNWQSALQLSAAKAAGVEGVIAKASEGSDFIDSTYPMFRAQAKDNGLIFGSYHFARPDTNAATTDIRSIVQDARREATLYLAAATPEEGDLIAVDFEKPAPLTASQMEFWAATFLDTVEEELGQPPMLYTNAGRWQASVGNSAEFGAYPLWLASWGPDDGTYHQAAPLPGWSLVTMQQYTSKGTITGYPDNLDRDLLNPAVDIASLQLGLQPTTLGDPYGPPYTLRFGETTLETAVGKTAEFSDGMWANVDQLGKVSVEGTRRTA